MEQQENAQRYFIATVGSKTERGGEVVTGCEGQYIGEHIVAAVGDTVRYPDGSESIITSGAGLGLVIGGRPAALVGSHIANGDRIVSSPQTVSEVDGECPVVGFLEPGFLLVGREGE